MAQITIADGETETVADGETLQGGPLVLDGTLSLDGTTTLAETAMQGQSDAGLTATPTTSGDKNVIGAASAGLTTERDLDIAAGTTVTVGSNGDTTATSVLLSGTLSLSGTLTLGPAGPYLQGEKDIISAAAAGVTATPATSGAKDLAGAAGAGLTATPLVSNVRPLRLTTSVTVDNSRRDEMTIDNSRRDEFDVQGVGEE